MHLFRKLKKSSGATCSDSSKKHKRFRAGLALGVSLVALPAFAPSALAAETGVVAATGSGGDTASAIAGLLRAAVGKYFAEEPAALRTSLLQNEIIPNASSFVQSYRLLESSKGSVSLSANVDLDVIRGLMSLTPAKLNAEANSKALIVVKGSKLPEQAASKAAAPANPFAVLELGAKDRFTRRQFAPVVMSVEEASGGSPNDEPTSADFLRSAGARAGARLALGVGSRREKFENENSHNKEDRIVLTATLLDVKSGNVLGRSSVNVNEPKGRRDQFNAELQRMLAEDSKDLFQDLFVAAGRRLGPAEAQDDFAVLRVQYPSNPILVNKLRALLEGSKALKSISEYGVRRGAFDFAIRPNLAPEALQKVVAALVSEEIAITPVGILADDSERRPALAVKISPKSAAAATIGGPSAMDQEDALNGKP